MHPTILAAYLSADTISYYCVGLPVCPSLCPLYLRDLCCPVSVLAARRLLRSAARGELLVPRAHLRVAIMQRRAFSVVGPSAWNYLPIELRSLLMTSPSKFCISLNSSIPSSLALTGLGAPLSSSV